MRPLVVTATQVTEQDSLGSVYCRHLIKLLYSIIRIVLVKLLHHHTHHNMIPPLPLLHGLLSYFPTLLNLPAVPGAKMDI